MKLRIPLYGQLLLWLALNLLVIAALFVALPGRSGSGWSMLLSQPVRDRLITIGATIGTDLAGLDESKWAPILTRDGGRYGVSIAARSVPRPSGPGPGPLGFDGPGPRGSPADFPNALPGTPPGPPPGGFGGDHMPPPPSDDDYGAAGKPVSLPGDHAHANGPHAPDDMISIRHSQAFGAYLVSIPSERKDASGRRQLLDITVSASDLRTLLGFLGVTEWVLLPLLMMVTSAALWWPFIWSITYTIGALTRATQRIADGRFDVRVQTRRRDELGSLAESVNRMAERLENFVDGQKRFVADVAHEITSPLARFQLGLGVIESRLPREQADMLEGLHEEAQQMADMLNELLLFSRSGITSAQVPSTTVGLRETTEAAIEQEGGSGVVHVDVDSRLQVEARELMLLRAIGNLVRNALRYAGPSGSIEIAAGSDGGIVTLWVRDRGPGVPPAALARLGEPFFRPEAARSRESGGVGLGLAIVRRCVAGCDGEVRFRNREGGGFEAEIRLPRAER